MSDKNITINFGSKQTVENYIAMLESTAVALSNYIDKSEATTKTAACYKPAIALETIKSIFYMDPKYDTQVGSITVVTKDKGPIPLTPIFFYPIPQLKVFFNWVMEALAKEKKKLEVMK